MTYISNNVNANIIWKSNISGKSLIGSTHPFCTDGVRMPKRFKFQS